MAKTKGRPPKPGGEGKQVRIDPDLASKARYVADDNGVSVTEYLSGLLRPLVDRDFREAGRRLAEKTDPSKKGRG